MNSDKTLPKFNNVAILLIIAFVLNLLFSTLSTPFLTALMGLNGHAQYQMNVRIATIIDLILQYLINIIIAIWTYREAKKQNEGPWVWTSLALFFGLISVIAFYLMLVIRELRTLKIQVQPTQKDTET